MQFGPVRYVVSEAEMFRSDTDQTSDVSGKAVLMRTVIACGWPVTSPGAVEKADHAVVENIQKSGQCRIVVIEFPVVNIIGDMEGHGTLGPE